MFATKPNSPEIYYTSDIPCAHLNLNLFIEINSVIGVGGIAIGEMLKFNEGLKFLDISETQLGPLGAQAIGEGLRVNKSLTSLNCACFYDFQIDPDLIVPGMYNTIQYNSSTRKYIFRFAWELRNDNTIH